MIFKMAGILVESEHQLSWFEFELSLPASFSEPLIISLPLYSPISYIVLTAKVFSLFIKKNVYLFNIPIDTKSKAQVDFY